MSTRRVHVSLMIVACILLAPVLRAAMRAQQNAPAAKPAGTAAVTGQVVDADTGAPVPGAIVALTVVQLTPPSAVAAPPPAPAPRANPPTRVLADSNGRFEFKSVAAGSVEFTVSAHNYTGGGYNQSRAESDPQPLSLSENQHVDKVTLRMWRTGAISGRILDEAGDPVVGVNVRVLRRWMIGGQLSWQLNSGGNTDDRGVYRASGLLAGDYIIEVPVSRTTMAAPAADAGASRDSFGEQFGNLLVANGQSRSAGLPAVIARDSRLATYPTVFYPSSSTMSHATVISLRTSEEKPSIDVQVSLVPAFTVGGVITDAGGVPVNVEVALVLPDDQSSGDSNTDRVATASTGARGEFTMLGVPPGTYQLVVMRTTSPQSTRAGGPGPVPPLPISTWARQSVIVTDRDIVDLAQVLRPSPIITGRVSFNGTSAPPTAQQLARGVRLEPVSAALRALIRSTGRVQSAAAPIALDGSFAIATVLPGQYMVLPSAASPKLIVSSITAGGRDASDMPLDIDTDVANVVITFSDQPGALRGVVHRDNGATDDNAIVVGFPANPAAWGWPGIHTFSTRVAASGTYAHTFLAPGEYLVAAIPDEIAQSWQAPDTLKRIAAAAKRVTIGLGAQLTQDLVTVSIK